jgi:FtsZ-binding cell division protein ZapB
VEELKEILEHLRADYNRKVQDIDILNIENESLKNEIDNLESLSLADSTRSLASKTHKYPDVICPHFKNGGKCKHCINKWKESQKMEN